MAIQNDFEVLGTKTDDFDRTEWFDEDIDPTIPGTYEARTGGGHVFKRVWTGETWINHVDGNPSKVRMSWRGIKVGSQHLSCYPSHIMNEYLLTQPI